MPANRSTRKEKRQSTLIFVLGAEFENEGTVDVDNEEGGDDGMDNDDGPMVEPKKYGLTRAKDWTCMSVEAVVLSNQCCTLERQMCLA